MSSRSRRAAVVSVEAFSFVWVTIASEHESTLETPAHSVRCAEFPKGEANSQNNELSACPIIPTRLLEPKPFG
jgi:hypothetical protein